MIRTCALYVAPPASKARIKTTSTLVDEYRIIVFGGYDGRRNHNAIRILDTRGMRWISEVPVTGTVPDGRNGHSATLAEGKLYIIGGWLGQGPLAAKDMHIFDVATSHWSEARTTGAPPGPCNMHTCDYVPRRRELYLFRGGDGQNYLNDLHVLNIDTMVWRSPATGGNPPSPRANHASAVVGSRLYIFGGWDGQRRLNDIHYLDTDTMMWYSPRVKGQPPSPRAGMTFTAVREMLFLFGGSGPQARCFNDLQVFDTTKSTWLATFTELPASARQGQLGDYVYPRSAGSSKPDNPNAEPPPADIVVRGKGPEHRAGHTMTLVNRKLFLFGGSYGSEYLSDLHVLDTDPPPLVRIRHLTPVAVLQRSLRKFLNNDEFSDVTFIVQGQFVYAHRIVLSLVSERFRAMFSSGFRESVDREIPLPDVSLHEFMQMMEYIYTGALPRFKVIVDARECQGEALPYSSTRVIDVESLRGVLNLLTCADSFMIDHLIEVCEKMLRDAVTSDTVHTLLHAAEMTNAHQLRNVCMHFLRNDSSAETNSGRVSEEKGSESKK